MDYGDWFFGDNVITSSAKLSLSKCKLPLLNRSQLQVDFSAFSIIDQISNDSNKIVYKALYFDKIIRAEAISHKNSKEYLIDVMINLSILQNVQNDNYANLIGIGYLNYPAKNEKLLILTEYFDTTWTSGVSNPDLLWHNRVSIIHDLISTINALDKYSLVFKELNSTGIYITIDHRCKCIGKFHFLLKEEHSKASYQESKQQSILDIGRLLLELMSVGCLHRNHEAIRTLPVEKTTIAEHIITDCPEELEALIYWCCEEHPIRRPTLSQCTMMIEDIYEKYCAILMNPPPPLSDTLDNEDISSIEENNKDNNPSESSSVDMSTKIATFNPFEDMVPVPANDTEEEEDNEDVEEEEIDHDKVSKMIKTFEKKLKSTTSPTPTPKTIRTAAKVATAFRPEQQSNVTMEPPENPLTNTNQTTTPLGVGIHPSGYATSVFPTMNDAGIPAPSTTTTTDSGPPPTADTITGIIQHLYDEITHLDQQLIHEKGIMKNPFFLLENTSALTNEVFLTAKMNANKHMIFSIYHAMDSIRSSLQEINTFCGTRRSSILIYKDRDSLSIPNTTMDNEPSAAPSSRKDSSSRRSQEDHLPEDTVTEEITAAVRSSIISPVVEPPPKVTRSVKQLQAPIVPQVAPEDEEEEGVEVEVPILSPTKYHYATMSEPTIPFQPPQQQPQQPRRSILQNVIALPGLASEKRGSFAGLPTTNANSNSTEHKRGSFSILPTTNTTNTATDDKKRGSFLIKPTLPSTTPQEGMELAYEAAAKEEEEDLLLSSTLDHPSMISSSKEVEEAEEEEEEEDALSAMIAASSTLTRTNSNSGRLSAGRSSGNSNSITVPTISTHQDIPLPRSRTNSLNNPTTPFIRNSISLNHQATPEDTTPLPRSRANSNSNSMLHQPSQPSRSSISMPSTTTTTGNTHIISPEDTASGAVGGASSRSRSGSLRGSMTANTTTNTAITTHSESPEESIPVQSTGMVTPSNRLSQPPRVSLATVFNSLPPPVSSSSGVLVAEEESSPQQQQYHPEEDTEEGERYTTATQPNRIEEEDDREDREDREDSSPYDQYQQYQQQQQQYDPNNHHHNHNNHNNQQYNHPYENPSEHPETSSSSSYPSPQPPQLQSQYQPPHHQSSPYHPPSRHPHNQPPPPPQQYQQPQQQQQPYYPQYPPQSPYPQHPQSPQAYPPRRVATTTTTATTSTTARDYHTPAHAPEHPATISLPPPPAATTGSSSSPYYAYPPQPLPAHMQPQPSPVGIPMRYTGTTPGTTPGTTGTPYTTYHNTTLPPPQSLSQHRQSLPQQQPYSPLTRHGDIHVIDDPSYHQQQQQQPTTTLPSMNSPTLPRYGGISTTALTGTSSSSTSGAPTGTGSSSNNKQLTNALSSFLHLVQRCNDTSIRAKALVSSMDQGLDLHQQQQHFFPPPSTHHAYHTGAFTPPTSRTGIGGTGIDGANRRSATSPSSSSSVAAASLRYSTGRSTSPLRHTNPNTYYDGSSGGVSGGGSSVGGGGGVRGRGREMHNHNNSNNNNNNSSSQSPTGSSSRSRSRSRSTGRSEYLRSTSSNVSTTSVPSYASPIQRRERKPSREDNNNNNSNNSNNSLVEQFGQRSTVFPETNDFLSESLKKPIRYPMKQETLSHRKSPIAFTFQTQGLERTIVPITNHIEK